MRFSNLPVITFLVAAALFAHAEQNPQSAILTNVVAQKAAKAETFAWGRMLTYYSGETWSTEDALTAVAIINPGMQIHPPHVHSEEEYLMILQGAGTWTVKGRDFPAEAGDVLYAAPWDEHGIKNSGDTPLHFVFLKWNPKPVEPRARPTVGND